MSCECCEKNEAVMECPKCIDPDGRRRQMCEECCHFTHRGSWSGHQYVRLEFKEKEQDFREMQAEYRSKREKKQKTLREIDEAKGEILCSQSITEQEIKDKVTKLQQRLKQKGVQLIQKMKAANNEKINWLASYREKNDEQLSKIAEIEQQIKDVLFAKDSSDFNDKSSDLESKIASYAELVPDQAVEDFPHLIRPSAVDYTSISAEIERLYNDVEILPAVTTREMSSFPVIETGREIRVALQSNVSAAGTFWVQPELSSEMYAELLNISYSIRKEYLNSSDWNTYMEMSKVPAIGDPCFARYSEDKKWYRSVVVDTSPRKNEMLVRFVDFGNSQYIHYENMLPAKEGLNLPDFPNQALECCLFSEVKPLKMDVRWALVDFIKSEKLSCRFVGEVEHEGRSVHLVELEVVKPEGKNVSVNSYMEKKIEEAGKGKDNHPFSSRDIRLLEDPHIFDKSKENTKSEKGEHQTRDGQKKSDSDLNWREKRERRRRSNSRSRRGSTQDLRNAVSQESVQTSQDLTKAKDTGTKLGKSWSEVDIHDIAKIALPADPEAADAGAAIAEAADDVPDNTDTTKDTPPASEAPEPPEVSGNGTLSSKVISPIIVLKRGTKLEELELNNQAQNKQDDEEVQVSDREVKEVDDVDNQREVEDLHTDGSVISSVDDHVHVEPVIEDHVLAVDDGPEKSASADFDYNMTGAGDCESVQNETSNIHGDGSVDTCVEVISDQTHFVTTHTPTPSESAELQATCIPCTSQPNSCESVNSEKEVTNNTEQEKENSGELQQSTDRTSNEQKEGSENTQDFHKNCDEIDGLTVDPKSLCYNLPRMKTGSGEYTRIKIDNPLHQHGLFWATLFRTEEEESEFDRFSRDLGLSAKDSPSCVDLKEGQIILAYFKKKWHRGQVESCLECSKFKVRFIDLGTSAKISLSGVKVLSSPFEQVPSQAIQCSLYVKDLTHFSKEAIRLFQDLAKDRTLMAQVLDVNEGKGTLCTLLTDYTQPEPVNINQVIHNEERKRMGRQRASPRASPKQEPYSRAASDVDPEISSSGRGPPKIRQPPIPIHSIPQFTPRQAQAGHPMQPQRPIHPHKGDPTVMVPSPQMSSDSWDTCGSMIHGFHPVHVIPVIKPTGNDDGDDWPSEGDCHMNDMNTRVGYGQDQSVQREDGCGDRRGNEDGNWVRNGDVSRIESGYASYNSNKYTECDSRRWESRSPPNQQEDRRRYSKQDSRHYSYHRGDRGRYGGGNRRKSWGKPNSAAPGACFNCGETGHKKRDCPKC